MTSNAASPGAWNRRAWLSAVLGTAALGGCARGALGPPAASAPVFRAQGSTVRLALVSCTDQTKPQPLWDRLLAAQPDGVIFGGDNVYASEPPFSVERLRAAYAQQAQQPGFQRLRQTIPHWAIWDDHDYGLNDGGADFAHKQASKAAFLEFWQVPEHDARHHREGIYHAEVVGPPGRRIQLLMLDTRWFKTAWKPSDLRGAPGRERYLPDTQRHQTVLGEAQWRWLAEQLAQPAELRLLVSGIQVLVDGHGWEHWGLFPAERLRLTQLISQQRARGVVVLSGDRHIGALYEARGTGLAYPIPELTASGVTHAWTTASEAGPNRLTSLVREPHFGLVEVDWSRGTLRLSLHGLQAGLIHHQVWPLWALQAD